MRCKQIVTRIDTWTENNVAHHERARVEINIRKIRTFQLMDSLLETGKKERISMIRRNHSFHRKSL